MDGRGANPNASPAYNLTEAMTRFIPKEQAVEEAVQAEMRERYPDLTGTPQVSDYALQAAHNNARSEMYKYEMDHLTKNAKGAYRDVIRTLGKTVPRDEIVRQQATDIIGSTELPEIRANRHQAAERKQNKIAHDLFAKGDLEGALEAKRKAFLNFELYRAATDAQERIDKDIKNFKKDF